MIRLVHNAALAAAMLVATSAMSTPITFVFSGTVVIAEDVTWSTQPLGLAVSGSLTYDTDLTTDRSERGRSNYSDQQLREILQMALRRSEQLALHVVGDAETDRLFSMMTSLAPPQTWKSKRVRVEHGDGIRAETLAQAAQLGVVVTQNPTHLPPPTPPGAPGLFDRLSLLKGLLSAGLPLALGSDGGPDEANPFINMMLACLYTASPGEALSREQALRAYTAGGAFAERQERSKGQIMPGMAADLAMLSQDVLTVPLQALPATRSLLTLVDGEIVYEDASLSDKGRT